MPVRNDRSEKIRSKLIPLIGGLVGGGNLIEIKINSQGSSPNTEYSYFQLTYIDEENNRKIESYYIKKTLPRIQQGQVASFFHSKRSDSTEIEFEILKKYSELGCNVSQPIGKPADNVLITRGITGRALDKKLMESSHDAKKRVSLLEAVSSCLSDLHNAGGKIQKNVLDSKILKTADIISRSDLCFAVLSARRNELKQMGDPNNGNGDLIKKIKNERKAMHSVFMDFFEILEKHFATQETQLIHGDMTTYHTFIDKDNVPWFIDFGKPKFGNVVFDLAPLYFSQDINLPINSIKSVFKKYVERDIINITGQKEVHIDPDKFREKFKSLLYGACFENIRRGAKSRFLSVVYSSEFNKFVSKHRSYLQAGSYYLTSSIALTEYLLENQKEFYITDEEAKKIEAYSQMLIHYHPKEQPFMSNFKINSISLANKHKRKVPLQKVSSNKVRQRQGKEVAI